MPLDPRNTNTLWTSTLVETLARLGLRHALISPGSRSTPLALAFAQHPQINSTPVLDERSASFFALGLAKRTGTPTALVCTSGTAAANFFPAIIEARESNTPLLILTADRPPELRHCSAPQAIDQQKLYGSQVLHFQELPLPEPKLELLVTLRQSAAHAFTLARQQLAPVHLNIPFREPLHPADDGNSTALQALLPQLNEKFFQHLSPPQLPANKIPLQLPPTTTATPPKSPLIIAGNFPHPEQNAPAILALAKQLRWPLLADALSPLRSLPGASTNTIAHYDLILRNPALAAELAPDFVLILGALPTSKTLRQWLALHNPAALFISPTTTNNNPLHLPATHLTAHPFQLQLTGNSTPNPHLPRWLNLDQQVSQLLSTTLAQHPASEPAATQTFLQNLPGNSTLHIANSMPVRDAEMLLPLAPRPLNIHANRGANGIDGTTSTALGLAHQNPQNTYLLTGDLSFLHDTNALLIAPKLAGTLTILLINNSGGAIFNHLPISQLPDKATLTDYWLTPQTINISTLAAAHKIPHQLLTTTTQLHLALNTPNTGSSPIRILEFQTNSTADTALRHLLQTQIPSSLK